MDMVQSKEDKKYRAEEDLRTLKRAEEIKADPERFKMCVEMAEKEMAAIKKAMTTTDMKKMGNKPMSKRE